MILPTKNGTFELSTDLIEALCKSYPHTDVKRELALMLIWLTSKPSQRWARPMVGIKAWLKKEEASAIIRNGKKARIVELDAWWTSDAATVQYGRKRGIEARPGENMDQYRARLRAA